MKMKIESNYDITIHWYKHGFIAETTIDKSKSGKYTNYELIFIVDRSGSMSHSYPILINKIIPYLLNKLKFPENKRAHFITFEDYVDYRKFTKKDFIECKESAPGAIEKMWDVFPKLRQIFIPENEKTPKTEFRVKMNEEEDVKMNITKGKEINKGNYGIILWNKISEFLNNLKIVNTEKT